ncbi:MAG: hypothetical protein JWR83_2895 [Aeromicrobium sp.]|nr:hypothetical protein [Aeromicrobium sp.]
MLATRLTRVEAFARVAALSLDPDESALLLLGEVGVGKSYLLQQLHNHAGVPARLVRANFAEADYPLAGLASFLSALDVPHEAELDLRSRERDGMYSAAQNVLTQIRTLVLPATLVLIDDIDLMDAASQTLLGIIAGRLAGTGVRIVATATTVTDVGPFVSMPVAQLSPLTLEQMVDLAVGRVANGDEATLRIVAGYLGGNPGLLFDQLEQLESDQLNGSSPLSLPLHRTPSLDRMTRATISALDPVARSVLDSVALAPMSHSAVLVDQYADAVDAIEDLIEAEILERQGEYLSLADPRIRIQLNWSLDSRSRRELRADLAERTEPFDRHLASWHRSFGLRGRERVDELLAGAIWLASRRQIDAAVEFAERALGLMVRIEDHATFMIRLCMGLLRVGEMRLAARYVDRARPDPAVPGQVLRLANAELTAHLFDSRVMDDDRVQTLVSKHAGANQDAAGLVLVLAAFRRAERWQVAEGRAFISLKNKIRPAIDVTVEKIQVMGEILDALDGIPADPDDVEPRLARLMHEALPPSLLILHARLLAYRERHAEARTVVSVVLNHRVTRAGKGISSDFATYLQVTNEMAAGEFRLARTAIADMILRSPTISRDTSFRALLGGWLSYSLGELDVARPLLTSCLELALEEDNQATHAQALALRGAIGLVDGDAEAAVVDLRRAHALSTRFGNPTLLRHWADYVEACVVTERFDEAQGAVDALESRLATSDSRWGQLALLRCRALVANDETAVELFTTCIGEFGRDESRYEYGRTQLCLASRLSALGLDDESRRARMAAVTAFETCGALPWSARAQRSESSMEGSGDMLDQFGGEEREVIRRVIDGQRTREIAGALYISIRTVELRLTSIYRTLGVVSRAELVALLT